MNDMMGHVIAWLLATRMSAFVQNTPGVIPGIQCVHILAISVVMSSVLLLNLRLVGLLGGGEPVDAFTRRYLPWVWTALVVLLLSGSILIIGEPNRDLQNTVFWTKMSLLLCAIVLTVILERPVLRNARYWDSSPRRHIARALALIALTCWVGIVLCGRWIAYNYQG
jgi:uncharacterized membrane protein SirB2